MYKVGLLIKAYGLTDPQFTQFLDGERTSLRVERRRLEEGPNVLQSKHTDNSENSNKSDEQSQNQHDCITTVQETRVVST